MGWKQRIAAFIIITGGLFLSVRPAMAAGVQRFTDSRGIIHITNLGAPDQKKETQGGDNQAPVSRHTFQGPENKLIKMRALGIIPPDEQPVESSEAPGSEAKTTIADEEHR